MSEFETPLSGGNVNQGVVRVGNTVRRAQTAASPTIHRLLQHLERVGFGACPRFLGVDDENREILSYIEGDTGHGQQMWQSQGPLVETARMLRAYHDATLSFVPHGDENWAVIFADAGRHEVICHNDFAPYNLLFSEGVPKAVVDFDLAGPGPRLRDVAYAAFWMAPLSFHAADLKSLALADLNAGCRRLTLFCQTYGVRADDELLEMVGQVLEQMADARTVAAAVGEEAMHILARGGHLDHWRSEKAAFDCHKTALKKALDQNLNKGR